MGSEIFLVENLFSAEWLTNMAVDIMAAAAILLLTFWLARLVMRRIVHLGYKYESLDDTLFLFLGKIARVLVIVFGGTVILNKFGVQTTSIIALLGAAGLAVGLALQGTLSNFAAGIMLIVFRPFQKDDYVSVGGSAGTVKQITIFTTELATPDNVQIIVPNGRIWGASITNYSAYDTRRVDFVFGVSYGSNLKTAEDILAKLIAKDIRIHSDPEPLVKVGNLNDSSVDFAVRVWCDRGDYWGIKYDMTRAVKDAFDKGGIDIPFPTTTIVKA
jgi:small conductance mechanosensitive channel